MTSITQGAAKFIWKTYVNFHKENGSILNKTPTEIVIENNLWLVDEWSHFGYCIVSCLENPKMIESYKKGKHQVIDSLIGKAVKSSSLTTDPIFLKELMPIVIERYF